MLNRSRLIPVFCGRRIEPFTPKLGDARVAAWQTKNFGFVGDGIGVGGERGDGGRVGAYADFVEGEDAVELDLGELGYERGIGGGEECAAAAGVGGVVAGDPWGEGWEGGWRGGAG